MAGCSHSERSEWERKNEVLLDKEETEVPPLPAYPKPATLVAFEVPGQRDFRNAIDAATLSVDDKGVVRYVVVARSPSGTENVSFEAMRCKTAEHRIYALGRSDGTWGGRPSAWRPIVEGRQAHVRTLYGAFFCPQGNPIADADEGRRALRDGAHPWTKGFSGDVPRGR